MLLVSELAERLPDDLLEGGNGLRDSCERALHLAFAEAQVGEGSKGFRTRIGNGGLGRASVGRAVGMGEMEV